MNDRVVKALIEPLNSEDRLLFARAYREHCGALSAFVRRRVSSDAEAADIVHEAYSRLLRYRDRQNLETLKSILFQIAINLLTDHARLAHIECRTTSTPLEGEAALPANDPSQFRQLAGEQDLKRVASAIEKLPRKCREVFVLRRFGGMSHQQISDRLGITLKAVEKHITTAVHLCRKKVGDGRL
jgi:RNA polymerase sigma factor (sigma-70 family)